MMRGEVREGPRRILVLDDEDADREFLRASLEPRGFDVIVAADDSAALHCIAQQSVDVLLLHVTAAVKARVNVCRAVRDDLKRPDVPIALITRSSDRELRILGKEAGADEFLIKPFDEVMLLARVQSLLKVKAYHDLRARHDELVEEQLARIRPELLHFDRLATLGTIAAGIGHELNKVAAHLMHRAHFIRERADQELPPEPEDIGALLRGVEHLAAHARNLLHLGFPGASRREQIDMVEVVTKVFGMFEAAGKLSGIEIAIDAPDEPATVTFTRVRLEQIWVNLIDNAVDAVVEAARPPRRIRIEVTRAVAARRVRCQIQDTGAGIPDTAIPRLFEPYFTTKPPDKGTGLGLSLVKTLIEEASGSIDIQSRFGEGTTVHIELPLTQAPPLPLAPV